MSQSDSSKPFSLLRQQAEELLHARKDTFEQYNLADVQHLIHELNVYQAELEIQNEQLRQHQQEIQEAHNRYRDLYDFAPVGYVTLDEQGIIVNINLMGTTMFGKERGTLRQYPLTDLMLQEDRDKYYFHHRQLVATQKPQTAELRMHRADGTTFHARLQSSVVVEPGTASEPHYRMAILNITEQVQAEEALRKAHDELEQRVQERTAELSRANHALQAEIVERQRVEEALRVSRDEQQFLAQVSNQFITSLDLVSMLHHVAHIVVNQMSDWCLIGLLEEYGKADSITPVVIMHRDSTREQELQEWFQQQLARTEQSPFAQVLDTDQPVLICDFNEQQHNQYQHYRQQGLVSFIGVPLSTRGRTIGVLGLFNDHTQRHYSEDDQQLVGELSHQVALAIDNTQLHAATQRARAEAERAVQVRDQVFRLITHDLRAPLTSIQGYAHLLKRRISSSGIADVEQFIRGLESIEEATRRMAAHIQELLDTASLQAGHALSLRWGSVNFIALVEQVVEACQEMSHKHVIRLDARVSHLTGSGDDMRLERVFNNLITNAIKYSPEGGEISVTITRERQEQLAWAVFSVQDQGIGIPADDLPLIFDSFHRAGNVGDAISGTGLGLASARQIVEQHGGKITVDSEEGVGTTFTVWLPIEASTADDESSA